jgi:hypothetical protein
MADAEVGRISEIAQGSAFANGAPQPVGVPIPRA